MKQKQSSVKIISYFFVISVTIKNMKDSQTDQTIGSAKMKTW